MPTYQYRNQTGQIVELQRPVALRDQVEPGLERITAPVSVRVLGGRDPSEPEQAVPRALRQLEEKMPAREIVREGGYTVDQMKQIWSEP
jgi:hypothetical protein